VQIPEKGCLKPFVLQPVTREIAKGGFNILIQRIGQPFYREPLAAALAAQVYVRSGALYNEHIPATRAAHGIFCHHLFPLLDNAMIEYS
jgi:hypothetical protein